MHAIVLSLALVVAAARPPGPEETPPNSTPPGADWSVQRAVGAPDATPGVDHVNAWATQAADTGPEWLELTYERAVLVTSVRIVQNLNPGAVVAVEAIDETGEPTVLWSGPDRVRPDVLNLTPSRQVKTRRIRVVLDTSLVAGWNEIDAVGVVDEGQRTHWAVGARASSAYGGEADSPLNRLVGRSVRVVHQRGEQLGTLSAVHAKFLELSAGDKTVLVARAAVITVTER